MSILSVAAATAVAVVGFSVVYAVSGSGDPYVLPTCPVSGGLLGSMGEPVVRQYDGREVRFCCAGCIGKFDADQAQYFAKIDAEVVALQRASYPLETCVVSGEKLGSMGEPVDHVFKNRLVRFCCAGCVPKFEKEPGKFLAKLDGAVVEKQQADYPLDTCVVSGEQLGGSMGEPVDHVVANRLVRLCCKGCIRDLEKDPMKYLSKLDEARRAQ